MYIVSEFESLKDCVYRIEEGRRGVFSRPVSLLELFTTRSKQNTDKGQKELHRTKLLFRGQTKHLILHDTVSIAQRDSLFVFAVTNRGL